MRATITTRRNGTKWGYKRDVKVTATAELVTRPDGSAYFSLTGKLATANGYVFAGGQIDELADFTVFEPVRLVHLADRQGVPLHAEANAKYWAGLTDWQVLDVRVLARHLQTSEAEADAIASDLLTGLSWAEVLDKYRLPQMWQAHADNAMWAIEKVAKQAGVA